MKFVASLEPVAAYFDARSDKLVFIRNGKYEIPVRYESAELTSVDPGCLEKLTGALPVDVHRSQCASILAEALFEVTSNVPASDRFSKILSSLSEVQDKFDRGYQLFAAGFSYEKIQNEVESARIEYTSKMHKVFSDIQNQLLGIPVATVIVATQMKPNAQVSAEFWISAAVLLGSFVFVLLVHFLLRNQRHTLEVIGIEVRRQKNELQKQPRTLAESFLPTFTLLEERYRTQMRLLIAIDWLLLASAGLSLFFFYQVSVPAQAWLADLIAYFTT